MNGPLIATEYAAARVDSVTASMKGTPLVGLGLLGVICAGALAPPARIAEAIDGLAAAIRVM